MIRFEILAPDPEQPEFNKTVRLKTGYEVFHELEQKLESLGLLPDEYLLLHDHWHRNREIPEGAYTSCEVAPGANEGILLSVTLHWEEDGQPQQHHFISGKTLGVRGSDMDRMYLIASRITQEFYGVPQFRYTSLTEQREDNGLTICMSAGERKLATDALLHVRGNHWEQGKNVAAYDRLMRRLIGDLTDYIQTVGSHENLAPQDRAVFAIHESRFDNFEKLLGYVVEPASLLHEAAGHAGRIGYEMTEYLLSMCESIDPAQYEFTCQCAVGTGEPERVLYLLEQSEQKMAQPDPALPGRVMAFSMTGSAGYLMQTRVAERIFETLSPEQIEVIDHKAVEYALRHRNQLLAGQIIAGGINLGDHTNNIVWDAAFEESYHVLDQLKRAGYDLSANGSAVLKKCAQYAKYESAKHMIDLGADYRPLLETDENREFLQKLDALHPEMKIDFTSYQQSQDKPEIGM